jgi:hypothetical protein
MPTLHRSRVAGLCAAFRIKPPHLAAVRGHERLTVPQYGDVVRASKIYAPDLHTCLIIECDDPKLLGRITELARICVNTQASEGQDIFKVIRLKNVGADDAARAISEVFNGPAQGGGGAGEGERGEVERKSNKWDYSAERYARALLGDGIRKGWLK